MPVWAEIASMDKWPISICLGADLILIPLFLELSAFVSIEVLGIKETVFEATIYQFSMQAITIELFKVCPLKPSPKAIPEASTYTANDPPTYDAEEPLPEGATNCQVTDFNTQCQPAEQVPAEEPAEALPVAVPPGCQPSRSCRRGQKLTTGQCCHRLLLKICTKPQWTQELTTSWCKNSKTAPDRARRALPTVDFADVLGMDSDPARPVTDYGVPSAVLYDSVFKRGLPPHELKTPGNPVPDRRYLRTTPQMEVRWRRDLETAALLPQPVTCELDEAAPGAWFKGPSDAYLCGDTMCTLLQNQQSPPEPGEAPGWATKVPQVEGGPGLVQVAAVPQCDVKQLPNRPHDKGAVSIRVDSGDVNNVLVQIGSYQGGSNILAQTKTGPSAILQLAMPEFAKGGGLKLFVTASFNNGEGTAGMTSCALDVYDVTLPEVTVAQATEIQSHRGTLRGSFVVRDDSPMEMLQYSVSLSAGMADDVLSWQDLPAASEGEEPLVDGVLVHFQQPKNGLVVYVGEAAPVLLASLGLEECATACILRDGGTACKGFDYNGRRQLCILHTGELGDMTLTPSDTVQHYFREDKTAHREMAGSLLIEDLALFHDNTYYINVRARNVLGFEYVASSQGTKVDASPPLVGALNNTLMDRMFADRCRASSTQRCLDATSSLNHRVVLDGDGSLAVFNGHTPGLDSWYARHVFPASTATSVTRLHGADPTCHPP